MGGAGLGERRDEVTMGRLWQLAGSQYDGAVYRGADESRGEGKTIMVDISGSAEGRH